MRKVYKDAIAKRARLVFINNERLDGELCPICRVLDRLLGFFERESGSDNLLDVDDVACDETDRFWPGVAISEEEL
jgi:hypothetical protein